MFKKTFFCVKLCERWVKKDSYIGAGDNIVVDGCTGSCRNQIPDEGLSIVNNVKENQIVPGIQRNNKGSTEDVSPLFTTDQSAAWITLQ